MGMIKRIRQEQDDNRKTEKTKNTSAGLKIRVWTVCLTLAVCAVYACANTAVTAATGKRELPVYRVARQDGQIAISFDAAWGGDKTKKILDILDEYEVKTTFFLVDIWTQRFPELVKEIDARGHEIGNHSTSHPQMSRLSAEKIADELDTMSDNVYALIGKRPVLFRPPYGDYNNRLIVTARSLGYTPIQWSVDSLDWKNRGRDDLVRRATENVQSGDIVLFHNDSDFIVDALPLVLESYREKGLTVVPVSRLLPEGDAVIDNQGTLREATPNPTKIPEVE